MHIDRGMDEGGLVCVHNGMLPSHKKNGIIPFTATWTDLKIIILSKVSFYDAEKDSRQEEERMTEDEMAGWHRRLDGHEFEQAPGVGDGQGGLACCSPWGCKESETTERLSRAQSGTHTHTHTHTHTSG